MLIEAIALTTLTPSDVDQAGPRSQSIYDKVCRLPGAAKADGEIGLVAVPEQKRVNSSGVLLLVNCTELKVVDVRDPSNFSGHLNKFVHAHGVTRRLPDDPRHYEILNFNTEASFHSTWYYNIDLTPQDWKGPCEYKGLQLITAKSANSPDRQTITFDLNICTNLILAIVKPPQASAAPATKTRVEK